MLNILSLLPKVCVICDRDGDYICDTCIKKFQNTLPRCPACLKISSQGYRHDHCHSELESLFCIYKYNPLAKEIIRSIKYKGGTRLINRLINNRYSYLHSNVIIQDSNSILVPIPLYKHKEYERGFNQSELFAKAISDISGIPMLNLVRRIRNTQPQSQSKNRFTNIRDAFECSDVNIQNCRNIILVDDIVTSGSTLNAATKAINFKMRLAKIHALVIFDARKCKKIINKKSINS